jgi:hypothetical protein
VEGKRREIEKYDTGQTDRLGPSAFLFPEGPVICRQIRKRQAGRRSTSLLSSAPSPPADFVGRWVREPRCGKGFFPW